jgi:hypothetical protein
LGFTAEYTLARYDGVLLGPTHGLSRKSGVRSRPAAADDHARILELDRQVTGIDRGKFLTRLFRERPADVRLVEQSGRIEGYVAARGGGNALQIGPCVASPDAGATLIADAAERFPGERVFLDVPQENEDTVCMAGWLGLSVQRTFARMCRGRRGGEDVSRLVLSSGPELG